jgi:hypothetical protein
VHEITTTASPQIRTPQELAAEVRRLTSTPAEWVARVRLDPEGRWYEQIHMGDDYELFGVVWGQLDEHTVAEGAVESAGRAVTQGVVRSFGPRYIHDVRNAETASSVAVSVHAYSPPLSAMTRYDLSPSGLVPIRTEGTEDW